MRLMCTLLWPVCDTVHYNTAISSKAYISYYT